ncbi:ASCH domain-containing protein [Calycomorphotria hydatis]|uniref:ASCH domain protein n=1 Tax=Calycomorphotria hydatis TaxID=2528027 RepID=A0A517TBQ1_9PLAN|nr:ASCH domain-containing protein [Calycomorphotria hydatis]QDT65793.1 ASCH domain protein [Calycomorphotria hydatis]
MQHPDKDLIALGIQQPWLELILRGEKTLEIRSQNTRVRGTIYLYASRRPSKIPAVENVIQKFDLSLDDLQYGQLLGTAELTDSRPALPADTHASCVPEEILRGKHTWRLENVQRLPEPLPVRFLPYGIWFYPFKRRQG